jgi:hypothetical protein
MLWPTDSDAAYEDVLALTIHEYGRDCRPPREAQDALHANCFLMKR